MKTQNILATKDTLVKLWDNEHDEQWNKSSMLHKEQRNKIKKGETMVKAYRHGDMALILIDNLPKGLKEQKTDILMKGSHGNNHRVIHAKFYPKKEDNFVFGYLKALKGCTLFHPEHGDKGTGKAKLPVGIYQLRKQNEILADELRGVQD
jgi:hypothetical protein